VNQTKSHRNTCKQESREVEIAMQNDCELTMASVRLRPMKRRDFLKSSTGIAGLIASTSLLPALAEEAKKEMPREFYELRTYHLKAGPMASRFGNFYRDAAIPAMNRAGLNPIGVFNVVFGPESPTMRVLIPHKSLESFVTANERIHADEEYQKAGAEFINAPATNPSYVRVESSLLVSFEGFPKLEVPASTVAKKPRIFELRTYESHSHKAGKKKIEMFNTGEIAIFKRTGLTPVFFGETIVGSNMPNLTYMLTFDDLADREKKWAAFGPDPEWQKLRSQPGFSDAEIVSNISNVILRPAAYSQI
jgi:hypothetical protein